MWRGRHFQIVTFLAFLLTIYALLYGIIRYFLKTVSKTGQKVTIFKCTPYTPF